jgi:hypothetical protein
MERLAIFERSAADAERMQVEKRPHRAELERRDARVGQLPAQQVMQQRRLQRPVHDEARIAFDLGHVAPVVVDPVAVERQRRVAE